MMSPFERVELSRRPRPPLAAVVGDDGAICDADQPVDEKRGRFTAQQVLAHRGDRDLGEQEPTEAHFLHSVTSEHQAGVTLRSAAHALGHGGHAFVQLLGPFALHEIVVVIQQQQATFVEMLAHPGRRVQRSPQRVAGIDRRTNPCRKFSTVCSHSAPSKTLREAKRW